MSLRSTQVWLLARLLLAAILALSSVSAFAAKDFQFGVIGHSFRNGPDAQMLKQAISETNQAALAFVVVNAIKASTESCSDKLYGQRKSILATSTRPLILSLAASDWIDCKNSLGRSTSIDRLNRLREVFFADAMSQGERKIGQSRLSASASFRSYAENAHWEHEGILFSTINLPANNNHYRSEAGRNSEFEDRLVANRSWLKRLFAMAQRKELAALVLISDGDAGLLSSQRHPLDTRHDGFTEVRHQIKTLAKKFPGQVLLIDSQIGETPTAPDITWSGNIGHLSVSANWLKIRVHPTGERLSIFSIKYRGQ
jgi:hypothetical protein